MRILGVADGLDASTCIVQDGKLLAAIQEERLSGVKNHVGFPYRSIEKVLALARLDLSQIDQVALSTDYVQRSPGIEGRTVGMSVHQTIKDVTPGRIWTTWDEVVAPTLKLKVPSLAAKMLAHRNAIRFEPFSRIGYYGPIEVVDHHVSHGASAYFLCPWKDEPVLVLTSDASGDGLSSSVSIGYNGMLARIAYTRDVNSLGILYTAVTKYLGMTPHEHEGKVTGLAPHANPKHGEKAYEVFKSYIGLSDDGLSFKRKRAEAIAYLYRRRKLHRDLEGHRFDSVAYGIQKLAEELTVDWVRACVKKTGIRKIAAGGGVFLNVKVNKLLLELPEVDDIFIVPPAGDAGTSIGAAYSVWSRQMLEAGQEPRVEPLGPLYFGDEPDTSNLNNELQDYFLYVDDGFDWQHTSHVDALAADLILKGEIVARCRGPMEFGPRALGNRSILCDASDLRVVREINLAIKSRDHWMPFAPVILEHRQHEYLVNLKNHDASYMVMAMDTKPLAKQDLLAALHNADLTARPQVLRPGENLGYESILKTYEAETSRGGLLNTSFNLHGSPLVYGVQEAMHTFLDSGLKHLVLGDYLLSKT